MQRAGVRPQAALAVLLALATCLLVGAFPKYRAQAQEEAELLHYAGDLEEDDLLVERRLLAADDDSRPLRLPAARSLAQATPAARAQPPSPGTAPARRPAARPAGAGEPFVCGNSTTFLTVSISGPANATNCTASLSLADNGSVTCKRMGQVFGGDCDVFEGGLYINVGYRQPSATIEPDIQAGLDLLGLGNLSRVGLLHVSLGGGGQPMLADLHILPNLQAVIGAENPNPANGFTGAALYLSGSSGLDVAAVPSLARLTDINGTTILQDLALANLTTGLNALQIVEGDFVVEDNPSLTSLAGAAQTLTTVDGQMYIASNTMLRSLAGANATTAAPGVLRSIGGQLVIGGNPALTALAGLEALQSVGGPITITQNQQLRNISALATYAKCASNPTSQTTPVPIYIQVIIQVQLGAPPITCLLNTFPAICAYIKGNYCPNPDGTPALIDSATGLGG